MKTLAGKVVRVLLVALILVALVAFARSIDWAQTGRAMRATNPLLLVSALLVNLLSLVFKGMRWWIFLRPVGATSLWLALRATFAGAALNNLLVAQGGDAARVIFVAREASVPSAKVLATLALERMFELIGYIAMLALAVSFLTLPSSISQMRPFALLSLVGMIVLMVYLVRHPEVADLPVLEGEGLLQRARHYGRGFLRTLTSISTGPRFVAALGLSVAVWALQVTTYMLTALSADFRLSVVGTIACLLAVNLGFAVRATPGNVGVFQMMYAMTAAAFGMDKEQATAVAFLIQAQQILPVTLLGLLAAPHLLLARRRETPRADNILPAEPSKSLD